MVVNEDLVSSRWVSRRSESVSYRAIGSWLRSLSALTLIGSDGVHHFLFLVIVVPVYLVRNSRVYNGVRRRRRLAGRRPGIRRAQ